MEELLVPKEEEPQTDVEQPHAEVSGVETSTQENLIDFWRMQERMWEHHFINTNRGGHLRGTLDTWPLLGNELRPSHLPLRKQCNIRFGLMLWWRSMTT